MKTTQLLTALLLAGGVMSSPCAIASTVNNINFTGALVADTCNVNGGPGGTEVNVTLPAVNVALLSLPASTAGDTGFALDLTGCSALSPIRLKFSGGDIDAVTGRLNNNITAGGGGAGSVQLRLLNSTAVPINLAATTAAAQNDTLKTTSATGTATLNYTVQYYSATGTAAAGGVASTVVYEIIYE